MNYLAILVATYIAMMPAGSVMPQQLISIATCESGLAQFHADGTLVTNPTSGAEGIFQMLPSHQKTADKMGLDLSKTVDNIEYGIWLYNRQGANPWLASKNCWEKPLANAPPRQRLGEDL